MIVGTVSIGFGTQVNAVFGVERAVVPVTKSRVAYWFSCQWSDSACDVFGVESTVFPINTSRVLVEVLTGTVLVVVYCTRWVCW